MARSTLTPQVLAATGVVPTFAAADALGSQWVNDGEEFLIVKNGSGAPINVTITTGGTLMGAAVADTVVAVAAGAEALIGPFAPPLYNQPTTDYVFVDFSAVTTVTVALCKV